MPSPAVLSRAVRLLGGLFLVDGLSLLWRGAVGGLFLFHESSTPGFVAAYLLHTVVGGVLYSWFGFSLLKERSWTGGMTGCAIAMTALAWAVPQLGADYFTGTLGAAYFVLMALARRARG